MTNKTEKKPKKQGPIRTGAVIPFIIFTTVVVVFNIFFLDSTLKKSFEYVGTQVNGAEVNVREVLTSFKELRFEVKGIEFTNKEDPAFNSFQIGLIRFDMTWDALLRGKVLIQDISVNDIQLLTKRAKKGYVVPPPPAKEATEENKMVQETLGRAQEEFKGNVFGDIAGVLGGESGAFKEGMTENLESKEKMAKLQEDFKEKEKALDEKMKSLPDQKQLNDLQARFNKIDWNGLSNLQKAPKVLKEIDSLKKEVEKVTKSYNDANKALNDYLKYVNDATRKIPEFINDDIKSIEKRLKLPSLDPSSIAQMLFGPEILGKLGMAQEYHGKIKKYLPPKKDKSEKEVFVKRERGVGLNYEFGRPNSYPLFWIQKINVDSKNQQGQMKGLISDITSNQKHINKSTKLKINGDFPGIEVRDIDLVGELDLRNTFKTSLLATVGKYLVTDKAISKSDDVQFIITKASTKSVLDFVFENENIKFSLNNSLSEIAYDNKAKSPMMDSVLKGVATSTPVLTLDANARGKLNNLKIEIQSNLAQAIEKTVKAQVQAKIDETKRKIKEDVERQIAGQKATIDKQINDAKKQYETVIAQGRKQMDDFNKKIDAEKKKSEKAGKKGVEDKAKKLLKGIKL